jgi:IS1 family transposase
MINKRINKKDIIIAYKFGNTDEKKLRDQTQHVNKHINNGIYQVKYPDYEKVYLQQTCRNLKIMHKQHVNDIKNRKHMSGFPQQVPETGHTHAKV